MTLHVDQRSIAPRFYHPRGVFAEMTAEDLDRSIPELFARVARRQPDAVAVKAESRAVTYGELDQASARIARAVRDRCGAGPGRVAVMLGRDVPIVAAVLGVLKAGKTVVVLDPAHPPTRNALVLEEADPALIIVDAESAAALGSAEAPRLDLGEIPEDGAVEDPGVPVPADGLAAIIFTSGTTGRPKGVVHDHRSLCHLVRELINVLRLTPEDRMPQLQPLTGIAGFRTVWTALLSGGALCLFDVTRDGLHRMIAWLRAERISFYFSMPTLFRHMVATLGPGETLPDVRAIRLGGEPVTRRDFDAYRAHFSAHAALLVSYNASEVSTIAWIVTDDTTVIEGDVMPVGFAREGTEIRLLGEDGRPVAPGAVGEIVLRSRFMSRGYWRRPDLTAERFLPDPEGGDERMYRTGDLGRLLPDGCLVHLGRGDSQVKVRGFRVEPGEIEAALMDDPGIKEAAVVARGDVGASRLVAYVVAARPPGPSIEAIRRRLEGKLPAHMVPPVIVVLDAMPLSPNGKVARQALPAPGRSRPPLEQAFVRPRTPLEEMLAGIWRQVLDVEAVGIHDRFLDLGGTSLGAAEIAARVQAATGVEVSTAELLAAPSVADMTLAVVDALAAAAPEKLQGFLAENAGPG